MLAGIAFFFDGNELYVGSAVPAGYRKPPLMMQEQQDC